MRRSLVLLVLAACGKHAPHDEPPPPLDRAAIYPLIMRAADLPTGPVRRPLVDGLVVTLAAGQAAGQAKLLREPDLQGLAVDDAFTAALANLEAAAQRGDIHVNAEVGSGGTTLDVVWGHDWRAAACLLLPGVAQQAQQQLHAETVYAVIPNRDVLVLFADPSLAATALAAEKAAPRPISDRVLRVAPPPLAWAN